MSDFGFDPSLILNAESAAGRGFDSGLATGGNLLQLAQMPMQRQLQQAELGTKQAQLGQLMYQQQRQRTLADLVSQNAGAYSDPYAHALAQGGYGQEAFDAQQRAFEMGQKILNFGRAITTSRIQAANGDPQKLRAITKTMPDVIRGAFGAPEDGASDKEVNDWAKGFVSAQITPEKQAELAQGAKKLNEVATNPITGGYYRKYGGLPASPTSQDGETAAPPGSKLFEQKQQVLKALGEDLDPTSGKSDLAVKANATIQAGQRLEALLNAPGPMTPQRLHEATLMTATIANGGNVPTEEQVRSMYPDTLKGKSAAFWQSTTGIPMDTGTKAFVDMMKNQSERETGVAKKQIRDYLLSRLPLHPQAFQSYPNEANQMAEAAGLRGLYDAKTGKALPNGGMVNVVSPDGRRGKIPAARLEEALKRGFKRG